MTIKAARDYCVSQLVHLDTQREREMTARIIFEDIFSIKNLQSEDIFLDKSKLDLVLTRLNEAEPLQYITHIADFFGLKYYVDPGVLIPRPETEELVHMVLSNHTEKNRQLNVIDIGVGSGCISITLKKNRPLWRVFGVDWSMEAINISKINARNNKVVIELLRLDFLEQEHREVLGKFDVIVSNPPYVSKGEIPSMSLSTIVHEPDMALFAEGNDPLIFYKKIVEFAQGHLLPDGAVYVELNEFLADEILSIFQTQFSAVNLHLDMQGKKRMISAIGLQ